MKDLRTFSIPTESVVPVLGALAVLSALLSLCLGAVPVAPGEVLAALLGRGSGTAASIVLYARLPRTCGCLLAGAALAAAGTIIQGVLGNPLAAPNIIGVNAGAGSARRSAPPCGPPGRRRFPSPRFWEPWEACCWCCSSGPGPARRK